MKVNRSIKNLNKVGKKVQFEVDNPVLKSSKSSSRVNSSLNQASHSLTNLKKVNKSTKKRKKKKAKPNLSALEKVQELAVKTEDADEFKQFKRKMRQKSKLNMNKELDDIKNKIFKEKILVKDLWDKDMKVEVRTLYNFKASSKLW